MAFRTCFTSWGLRTKTNVKVPVLISPGSGTRAELNCGRGDREEFTLFCSKRPRTVSVPKGRGPQSGCLRKACVLGRSGGKRDSKCCHRADEGPQDGKFDVLVRVQEHNPSDVDGMKRSPSQSLFRCQIRPEKTRNYDPGDEQSDHHFD